MRSFWINSKDAPRWGQLPTADALRREVGYDYAPELFAGAMVCLHEFAGRVHLDVNCRYHRSAAGAPSQTLYLTFDALIDEIDAAWRATTNNAIDSAFCQCAGGQALVAHIRRSVAGAADAVDLLLVNKLIDAAWTGVRARSARTRASGVRHLEHASERLDRYVRVQRIHHLLERHLEEAVARRDEVAQALDNAVAANADADRAQLEQSIRRECKLGDGAVDDTEVIVGIPRHTLSQSQRIAAALGVYQVAAGRHATIVRCPLWVWNWMARYQRTVRQQAMPTLVVADDRYDWIDNSTWPAVLALYAPADTGPCRTIAGALEAAQMITDG